MACTPTPQLPCRANLDLMPQGTAFWMYVLSGVAFAVFCYGVWQMVHVWRLGRPWKSGSWRAGLARLVAGLATHRKFIQDKRPGTLHAWVFFGFAVLFVGTLLVALDADLFEHLLGRKLLFGDHYLLYEATLDTFGLVYLIGLGYLLWRRYSQRPRQLHRTDVVEAPRALRRLDADLLALVFLFLIGVTGFLLEALRLRYQVQVDGITYAPWSYAGNALGVAFASWTPQRLLAVYPLFWWTHFTLWTTLLAILPWTKVKHILTSSLNLYFHDPKRQSLPGLPTPFHLEKVMASGAADIPPVGYATIRDLTWKDRLSLDACTNCGRCESQCPATAAGRPLSPRRLIQDLKAEMWNDYRAGGSTAGHKPRKLTEADGVGPAIQEATLWSCTTCRACVTACPVDIEHVDLIMEMRRGLVMESKLDENQTRMLVNITNAGNPYGFPASDRANWTAQLPPGVVVPTAAQKAARGESFEWLWWIGCSGSFDPRNQQVTRSVATILNAAGVSFAILGTEERCNGDPARRLGEEGRFQQSVLENRATLRQY
ncbi:MAG: 4Fe-4S dicluster domain-containing protein, partial [Halobacteriales archaeon]|nr:4Fe-4S dicluster domain-containing protein [Halobacteriales archaeon]